MSQAAAGERKRGRPPKSDNPDDRLVRERIMSAAAELFRSRGYAGSSVKEITAAAGVSPAAMYWHFPSKEELLYALLLEAMKQYDVDVFDFAAKGSTPPERLRLMAEGHVLSVLTQPKVVRVVGLSSQQLADSLAPEHFDRYNEENRKATSRWRKAISDGSKEGLFHVADLTITVFAIIDMCEASQSWFRPLGPLAPADVAAQYGELALRIVGYDPS